MFNEPHKQHVWAIGSPVIVQLFFGLGADGVVGRGQGLEELGQGSLHLGRENRHGEDLIAMTCNGESEVGVRKEVGW